MSHRRTCGDDSALRSAARQLLQCGDAWLRDEPHSRAGTGGCGHDARDDLRRHRSVSDLDHRADQRGRGKADDRRCRRADHRRCVDDARARRWTLRV